MTENVIAALLGILALVVFVIYILWRQRVHRDAIRNLTEDFMQEEKDHESHR